MSPRGRQAPQEESRECPFCKERVKATAVRCRYCQAALVPTRPDHGGQCPFCKETVDVEAIRCKHCRSDIGGVGAMIIHGAEASPASAGGSLGARGIIIYDSVAAAASAGGSLGARRIIINGFVIDGIRSLGDPGAGSPNAIIIHAQPQ